jgi:23S rRNA-/tRNA-specific pseudouridylate synthase
MSYIGAPVHGDRVYGKAADRLYLHAAKLEVTIPPSNRQTFIAPVPKEFTAEFPKTIYS